MKVKLENPKDVRNYIEDLISRVPEENAAAIAGLLQVWMKAWASDEVDEIERRMAILEESINERTNSFMEETEELMEGIRVDLERRGGP